MNVLLCPTEVTQIMLHQFLPHPSVIACSDSVSVPHSIVAYITKRI